MSDLLAQYQSLTPTIQGCSKADLTNLAEKQANEILENGSSEIAYAAFTKIEHLITETKKRIKEDAFNEVSKGNDSAFGVKMAVMAATRYDYSGCADEELEYYEAEAKECAKLISDRKDFLKALKSSIVTVSESTGETSKTFPPLKLVTDTIKTKF
jgi:copper homeostasis protein CutC